MTQAQHIANIAFRDFPRAIRLAVETGWKRSTGFGTMDYDFADGSTLSLRAGRVMSPRAQTTVMRDACGDLFVKVGE